MCIGFGHLRSSWCMRYNVLTQIWGGALSCKFSEISAPLSIAECSCTSIHSAMLTERYRCGKSWKQFSRGSNQKQVCHQITHQVFGLHKWPVKHYQPVVRHQSPILASTVQQRRSQLPGYTRRPSPITLIQLMKWHFHATVWQGLTTQAMALIFNPSHKFWRTFISFIK